MSYVDDEIRSQPAAWRRAAALVPTVADALPRPGERIAVTGCGTSWFMAEAYAVLREEVGLGEADFFTASRVPAGRHYDQLLAITRSGTTTEVLEALTTASCPTTVITADADTPVLAAADRSIVLDFADERSVVQTVFATTTLALLRAACGEDIERAAAQAEQILAAPVDATLDQAEQYTFLGQGWSHGIAREAALKLREAAQAWTESYPQMEYRHGPIAIAEAGRVVWVVGRPVAGLPDQVRATGATVVSHDDDPMADLVRVQLLAVRRAERAGLDPDRPRHLSRSVVLAEH